jgi:hypothetical protein
LWYFIAAISNTIASSHLLIKGVHSMAIKSSTFGRVELSGKDAARFVQQVSEAQPNPLAVASLARGRAISEKVNKGEAFKLKRNA